MRDLGPRDRFTGEVPIATGEVDDDVEVYLRDSEQIDSALGCEVLLDELGNVVAAAGVLVQALPNSDGSDIVAAARERLTAGAIADILAAASDDPDAITTFEVAGAVLGDESGTLQLLDQRPVRFHCPCSRERATSMLELLGEEDLSDMIRDEGRAEVTCNFCRRQYEFSESELESVRRRLRATETPPN